LLTNTLDWKSRFRVVAALKAVKQLHHRVFQITLEETLPSLFRALPDDTLHLGTQLLAIFNDYWHTLPSDVQLELEAFVAALPQEHFGRLAIF
jgi:hypothetical protein